MLRKNNHHVITFARSHPNDIYSDTRKYFPPNITTDSIGISLQAIRTPCEMFYSRKAKSCLQQMLLNHKADLAHAHNIYGRLTTSVLDLLSNMGIPVVMTLHDYKLICPSYKLMLHGNICEACEGKHFYRAIVKRCHKDSVAGSLVYAFESYFNSWFKKYRRNIKFLISPSHFLKEKMLEFGWPEWQVEYLPNFILLSDFVPHYQKGDHFLYIGRLSPEKGVSTLIRAFREIRDPNAKLLVVGDGPLMRDLKASATSDSRIAFTGYLSGIALQDLTRRSLSVVIPSEWYENAPISILEAFAYGKPVIGANIGGIPEMVKDGVNGYLFQSGNAEDLRAKMESILAKSNQEVREMGLLAREKVEHDYDAEVHYEQLMELYKKALIQN